MSSRFRIARTACACLGTLLAPFVNAAPGDTEYAVVDTAGEPVDAGVLGVSTGGRFVLFWSDDDSLVPDDTNLTTDLFVRDRLTGLFDRVNVSSSGQQSQGQLSTAEMSSDGRFVAFVSDAVELVPNDAHGTPDVFVHDRETGVTERVSIAPNGQPIVGGQEPSLCNISDDGTVVAFKANGTNAGTGPVIESHGFVLVRDRKTGTTRLASRNSAGVRANAPTDECDLSANGRFVTESSSATNLVPNDTNAAKDVFVHDLQTGTTELVSLDVDGRQFSHESASHAISADGHFVVFAQDAPYGHPDALYVRDRWGGRTERVDRASDGTPGNGSSRWPSISANGRYVAFGSTSSNLVPGDVNRQEDVFWRDRVAGVTEIVSIRFDGLPANGGGSAVDISADGQFVLFNSGALHLVRSPASPYVNNGYVHEAGGGGLPVTSLSVRPASLAFGPQVLGTSRTLAFRLRNTGTTPLSLAYPSRIFLKGRDVIDFRLAKGCGSTLPAGALCTLSVTFRPTSVGHKVARLRVIVEGIDRTREISGTGVTATP